MMIRRLFVLSVALGCLLLLWTGEVRAQTPTDSQAYFQWMLAITDSTLTPRMAAHFNSAGLQDNDRGQAALILQKFKAEELELEAKYSGLEWTQEAYDQQADITQRAIDKLRATLSPTAFVGIDNRVHHEKANIKTDLVAQGHDYGSHLIPVSYGRPQRLGMTPNYTYYTTSAVGANITSLIGSMFTEEGTAFPQWNASNLVDNNTSSVGFSTDTSQAWQSWIAIDLGSPVDVNEFGLFTSGSGYKGQFYIYYSDDFSHWTNVVGSSTGTSPFAPVESGWNYTGWVDAGAHRWWALDLSNTPGAGPTINELQLIQPGLVHYTTSQVTGNTNCPDGCPPLAKHVGWAQVVTPDGAVHNTYGPQVYPTSYINVSDSESAVLPVPSGDPPPTTGTTGGVNCTVAGNGFSGTPEVQMDIRFERALTQSYISALLDSNGMHPEHIYCIIAATPPDFPGPDEALPGTSAGQVVNIAFMYREWPLGTQEKGVLWKIVFPKLQRFGLGYYVVPTMEPDPSGCTMWDNGFRNLPLPTAADPQPSSPW